jgi:hypothetical protein
MMTIYAARRTVFKTFPQSIVELNDFRIRAVVPIRNQQNAARLQHSGGFTQETVQIDVVRNRFIRKHHVEIPIWEGCCINGE